MGSEPARKEQKKVGGYMIKKPSKREDGSIIVIVNRKTLISEMEYFDLNIPYLESDKKVGDMKKKREIRGRTMGRAVELGYSGIAYNRTIEGGMSQSDACTIHRFPLSSLLKHHKSLSSHRRLPDNRAFRQYTRLTLVIDSHSHSSSLNSGNPVLNSYDLVAVRPLTQSLFDHACLSAHVHIISIDFGNKLPFRLKLSSVKSAIQRGLYFEIMYSTFFRDALVRSQMISTAKLLVEWTRGRNLIVSSAAPTFHELRGPIDVSNLLHLIGLSNERAKSALSKNCRLLIANALRKKQFYKEAIRVEMMTPGVPTDPKAPWIVDYLNWDPLSSGEGDLLLEDLAKSFAESGKVSQPVKSVDSTSLTDNVPSHVNQCDVGFRIANEIHLSSNAVEIESSSMDLAVPKEAWKLQQESTSLSTSFLSLKGNSDEISEQAMFSSLTNSPEVEEYRASPSVIPEESTTLDTLEETLPLVILDETCLHNCAVIQAEDMVVGDNIRETTSGDAGLNVEWVSISRHEVSVGCGNVDHCAAQADTGKLGLGAFNNSQTGVSLEVQLLVGSKNSLHSSDSCLGDRQLHQESGLSSVCADKITGMGSFVTQNNTDGLASEDVQQLWELPNKPERGDVHADEMMNVDSSTEGNNALELLNPVCVEQVTREHDQNDEHQRHQGPNPKMIWENEEHHSELKTDAEKYQISSSKMQVDSYPGKDDSGKSTAKSILAKELLGESKDRAQKVVDVGHQSLCEGKSGNLKAKRSGLGPVLRFPFKRLLQPQFMRKGKTSMYKTKKR